MIRASDVAARLGLKRYPRSWRGRCPCCDYAGSTLSVRTARDGRAQLYCANGCDRVDLTAAVAKAIGQPSSASQVEVDAAASRERRRERALSLWCGSEPATGTLADRSLLLAASQAWQPRRRSGSVPTVLTQKEGDCRR